MIADGLSQKERIVKLNKTAKIQLEILKNNVGIKRLEKMDKTLKLDESC